LKSIIFAALKFSILLMRRTQVRLLSCAGVGFIGVLLSPRPAAAVLNYYIYESGGNVVVEAAGTLNLGTTASTAVCNNNGLIANDSSAGALCTGPQSNQLTTYTLSGPSSFGLLGTISPNALGTTTSLLTTSLLAATGIQQFGITDTYISGQSISSISTFAGSLSSLGITTTPGNYGTWTLTTSLTSDTINLIVGAPGPSPGPAGVPGPLPLLGAGAAFSWSRRLRRRCAAPGAAGTST
jgi:hypothetical protein